MKEGWTYKKLGEVATYINGFPFKPTDWEEEGRPIIRIQNLTNSQNNFNRCSRTDIPHKYFVTRGDVLISWSATLGIFEWELEDALLNQHIFKVVFDKIDIDKQYFKYAVLISIAEMAKHTNGATMKHIRKGDFDNIMIPLPSLSEQQRIVSRLDAAFAHIDALKANAEKQLSDAKALFQRALTQAMEPKEGWEEKKLGEIAKICLGLTHTPKYQESGVPFISVKDISSGKLTFRDTKYISKEEFDDMPDGAKPQKGDLLFCRVGTIGKPQILQKDIPFGIFVSVGFLRIDNIALTEYVKYWMESPLFYKQVEDNVQGSTLKNLNTGWLKNFTLPIPPINEISYIVSRLDELSDNVKKLEEIQEKTIKECDALKQAILREVFE